MLTAIVIGFGMLGFAVALAWRTFYYGGDDDLDAMINTESQAATVLAAQESAHKPVAQAETASSGSTDMQIRKPEADAANPGDDSENDKSEGAQHG